MSGPGPASDFDARLERVSALVERLERHSDLEAREAARELVATVLELHARGLARLLELCGEERLLPALSHDPALASLLLLHGLHPDPLGERVQRALARLEPSLARAGGSCELAALRPGELRIRARGPASVRSLIAEALEQAVPDAGRVVVDLEAPLVQLRLHRDEARHA
ncbi:MAG TPA: hypothetical protein VGK73_05720 [Polyangiaceae bacterium]